MPKVSTKSLRSLVSKCNPSILTGAIAESADYIEELEKKVQLLESSLKTYKEENKKYKTALQFYEDGTKYFYAKQDHPNTRLAEDGGEIARKALLDKHHSSNKQRVANNCVNDRN
ncbi:hypothetical protein MZM54_05395 [[Brevibacterium] frigoritolerans]|nr:hypothetical protein [Peribacillus frigoritolerans]